MITFKGHTPLLHRLMSPLSLLTTVIILHLATGASSSGSVASSPGNNSSSSSSSSNSSVNKDVLAMHDSSQYMTLTTTPPSAVVEVITLNSTHAKTNETLKAQEQNQFPASPYGGQFVPGQSPIPPHLLAALQRRQQLLQAQSKFFFFFYALLHLTFEFSFLLSRRRETSECSATASRILARWSRS